MKKELIKANGFFCLRQVPWKYLSAVFLKTNPSFLLQGFHKAILLFSSCFFLSCTQNEETKTTIITMHCTCAKDVQGIETSVTINALSEEQAEADCKAQGRGYKLKSCEKVTN